MVSATTALPRDALPPSERGSGSVRRVPDEVTGDFSAVAFGAVLALARTSTDIRHTGVGGKLSPSQMFEPAISGDQDKTQAARGGDNQAEKLDQVQGDRLDRASVGARRALQMGQSNDTQSGSATGRSAAGIAQANTGKGAVSADITTLDGPLRSPSTETTGAHMGVRAQHDGNGLSGLRTAAAAPANTASLAAADQVAPAASQSTGSVAPAATGPRSSAANSAQQVAQLLASSRAGDVESIRPVQPASGLSGQNASKGQHNGPQPGSVGQQGRAGPGEASTSHAGVKAEPAQRSPFEKLVRAIRLQTGVKSSSARMHLHPPELGRLHVELRVDGDKIQIDVRTETDSARDLVYERAARLTQALERQGIHVGRFDVTTDPPGSEQDAGQGTHDAPVADEQRGDHGMARRDVPVDGTHEPASFDTEAEVEVVEETRLDIKV